MIFWIEELTWQGEESDNYISLRALMDWNVQWLSKINNQIDIKASLHSQVSIRLIHTQLLQSPETWEGGGGGVISSRCVRY